MDGSASPRSLPFASTGPAGHRARMRARLLERGGDGLADYELLEMLLFLGIPRGDTKPLAKTLINRFGSLAGVLVAPATALNHAGIQRLRTMVPLRLAVETAERLARADNRVRPVLGNLAAVADHLAAGGATGATSRLLHLDNRNRLLADEAWNGTEALRGTLRRALEHGATALILADHARDGDRPGADAAAEAKRLGQAAALLAITLHDRLLIAPSGPSSFRAAGLLG